MKDTYYFSHDYNAKHDEKIKNLMYEFSWNGYGIYWGLIEDLYINEGYMQCNYERIAYDMKTDSKIIKSIIEDFELFEIKDGKFFSKSILYRLKNREEKSNKFKLIAEKRWGNDPKRIKANNYILYLIKIYNKDEVFLKIGITTESISRRYSGKLLGYDYDVLFQKDMTADDAMKYESEFCANFAKYTPKINFAGYLECISINELDNIMEFAMRENIVRNAIKKRKEKKRKEKEIKGNIDEFELFKNNQKEKNEKYISLISEISSKTNLDSSIVENQIISFISYWSESSSTGRQRYQKEKFFEVRRRLSTWFQKFLSFNK